MQTKKPFSKIEERLTLLKSYTIIFWDKLIHIYLVKNHSSNFTIRIDLLH